MAPSCCKQQLQTPGPRDKILRFAHFTQLPLVSHSAEFNIPEFKMQFHVVVLTQTGSPIRVTAETQLQFFLLQSQSW